MRRLISSLPSFTLLLSLSVGTAGCSFYFGDDDDDQCLGVPEADSAFVQLRNPETGQCEDWGGGGWCDPECGPCPAGAEDEPARSEPWPSWGYCTSQCTGLDENTCMDTAGCRAAYVDVCPPNADCDLEGSIEFQECWAVDQTGPIQGDCSGLDAYTCSQHDDCRAVHSNPCLLDGGACIGDFSFCVDEPEEVDPGNCWEEALCDRVEPDCPAGTVPGVKDGCYTDVCIPLDQCEPRPECGTLDEYACIDRGDCDALYEGVDCICDASGCSCAEWLYDSCVPME